MMGITFRTKAMMRQLAIVAYCQRQTDHENLFYSGNETYLIEWSTRKHDDGSITGQILRYHNDTERVAGLAQVFEQAADSAKKREDGEREKILRERFKAYDANIYKKSGSIRIEADGKMTRGMACLKATPFLFVQVNGSLHGEWPDSFGNPTVQNLTKYIEEYKESFKPGGVNSHIGQMGGLIEPNNAQIVNGATGWVVAEWKAPVFLMVA